jgi:hypothetical protein
VVSRRPRHAPEEHGLVPSAHPVLNETKVTEIGSKLAAVTAGAAASAGAGARADPEATAPPVASPPATSPTASSPAHTNLDLDHHDPFAFITTRIRWDYEPIADPEWPDLPNRADRAPGRGRYASRLARPLAGFAAQEPLELGGDLVACGQVGELDGREP